MRGIPLTFAEIFELPLVLDLRTAARALDVSVATARRLIQRGEFPCEVVRAGHTYRVPTAPLMRALGIEQYPVRPDAIASGISLALEMENG